MGYAVTVYFDNEDDANEFANDFDRIAPNGFTTVGDVVEGD